MEYTVRRGDNIAHVNKMMDNNWRTVKTDNPQAATSKKATFGSALGEKSGVKGQQEKTAFSAHLKKAAGLKNSTIAASGTTRKPSETVNGNERSHTLKAGDTVWELAVKVYHVNPEEIIKLNNITDPRKLQIGRTLRIPGALKSTEKETVVASWYGSDHHGRPMANGDPFDMYGPTIAHKELPLGTRVLLENPKTGEKATATVTDRGPYIKGRDVDLSYKLAQRLSLEEQGVGNLTLQIL
jgi:rare lipoprotein A